MCCVTARARELGVTPRAATLAGAIYAFSPVVVGHLYAGHFELLWTFWIPAIALAFLRLIGSARRSRLETSGGPRNDGGGRGLHL